MKVARRLAVLAAAITAVPLLLAAPSAGAQERGPSVLVLSLPTLTWADLHVGDTPHLDALVDASAVAALSLRVVEPLTDSADAYATISAGTRARGVAASGQVLQVDERHRGSAAGDVYRQRTGKDPGDGAVALGAPGILRRNDGLDFDAHPGVLGDSLRDAGVPRAVIANADGLGVVPAAPYERTAGTALMDTDGIVPGTVSGPGLLESAADAPFGIQLSIDEVDRALAAVWPAGGAVLVEASDLVRADRYDLNAEPQQRVALRRQALRHSDELVGRLLERVDPGRDSVLVVAPFHGADRPELTVAALRGPDVEPGLLESSTTRRAGLVALVDVGPTILDLVGVDRPGSMEGRPFERTARGAATSEGRADDLERVGSAALFRDRMVAPVAVAFVALQAVLLLLAAVARNRWRPWSRRAMSLAALAMLAYLPATYLAGLLPFYDEPTPLYWAFVVVVAGLIAALGSLLGRRNPLDPLLLVLATGFGLLIVDMLLGAPLQLNTVFGYSPTVGGRFAGMGNLAFGQFAGAALLLYGLLLRRLAGSWAAPAVAFGVLGVAILIDGMPIWGSDVGGVLALVPAVGVTVAGYLDKRVRWRSLLVWASAAVGVVAVFAALDLTRPAGERTHLGRLVEAIGDEGLSALETVVSRKLGANLSVITSSVWTAMVPIALAFAAYLLWRAPGHLRAIRDSVRESLAGLAVVGVLGFALNDSGIAVPGVMLGVINASLVYLTVRALPPDGPPPAPVATTSGAPA